MGDRMTDAFIKEAKAQLDRRSGKTNWRSWPTGRANSQILAMKPEGVAALQMQIKKIHDMMGNRSRFSNEADMEDIANFSL